NDVGPAQLTVTKGAFAANGEDDNFAMHSTGFIHITEPGIWRFSVSSDDGDRLLMGTGNTQVTICECGRPAGTDTGLVTIPSAGYYHYDLIWEQGGGDAEGEFFAQGPSQSSPVLVGDTANSGLPVF